MYILNTLYSLLWAKGRLANAVNVYTFIFDITNPPNILLVFNLKRKNLIILNRIRTGH